MVELCSSGCGADAMVWGDSGVNGGGLVVTGGGEV